VSAKEKSHSCSALVKSERASEEILVSICRDNR
jgi:hypothetical protein